MKIEQKPKFKNLILEKLQKEMGDITKIIKTFELEFTKESK